MARQIEIYLTCEWKLEPCDIRVPEGSEEIVTRTVTIDKSKPTEIMLCKEHNVAFDDVIMPLMAGGTIISTTKSPSKRSSSPTTTPSPSPEPSEEFQWTCLEPDCGRPIKNNVGMAQHVGPRGHGYPSLDAYRAAHGLT